MIKFTPLSKNTKIKDKKYAKNKDVKIIKILNFLNNEVKFYMNLCKNNYAKKILLLVLTVFSMQVAVYSEQYTVKSGDSMWIIAKKYQVGLSELISANPQIKNPAMIYPDQKINIPDAPPLESVEKEVFNLVNKERKAQGLSELSYNWEVARVARIKSQDMINNGYFSHTSPVYGTPFNMLKNFGINYKSAGENIAMGQKSASEVMNSWMNSSGHRANILNNGYKEIGVGAVKNSNGTIYWTQMFISK